ncbi:MAG: peptide-methionine (S)-S-oxide reductase MsrA [Sebaldella sp.]|nr:peptide-methionine (S)-S-oxide reductase MsrA [Sebaldella sp.]
MKEIILAGGCFWGVEAYFQRLNGVVKTIVGYIDGITENPSYEEVCSGTTNHAEACKILYDEKIISLEKILEHFFRIIDPTTLNRQGHDIGTQYRSGVYYNSAEDRDVIEKFINKKKSEYSNPIVVEIKEERKFWTAEEYHQNYLIKNPKGYCHVNLDIIQNDEIKPHLDLNKILEESK